MSLLRCTICSFRHFLQLVRWLPIRPSSPKSHVQADMVVYCNRYCKHEVYAICTWRWGSVSSQNGFMSGFLLCTHSSWQRTFRQSKNLLKISQNRAVSTVSDRPSSCRALATLLLKTCIDYTILCMSWLSAWGWPDRDKCDHTYLMFSTRYGSETMCTGMGMNRASMLPYKAHLLLKKWSTKAQF